MKPLTRQNVQRKCRRCNKHLTYDVICPACKNELISMYDNKLGWKTAYEIEKISRMAMRNTKQENLNDFD
ncbi:MAG: hypothetical protein JXB19_06460 [Bacteroidales bacterium]|nr:hypothetical protein [Bacteroidales bacterium]